MSLLGRLQRRTPEEAERSSDSEDRRVSGGKRSPTVPEALASALAAVHREKQRAPSRGAPPAEPASTGDVPRVYRGLRRWAGWYEQLVRIQGRLVDRLFAPGVFQGGPASAPTPAEPTADARVDAELLRVLARAERLVLKHPVAAQAAFAALVAEGRAFARTEDGSRYEAALRRSPVFERASHVFDMVTGSALLDAPGLVLPSTYVDTLVRAAAIRDLGPYFAGLLAGRRERDGRDR